MKPVISVESHSKRHDPCTVQREDDGNLYKTNMEAVIAPVSLLRQSFRKLDSEAPTPGVTVWALREICRVDQRPPTPRRNRLTLTAGSRCAVSTDRVDQAVWFEEGQADFYSDGPTTQSQRGLPYRPLVSSTG
jgi:hypothetical protein